MKNIIDAIISIINEPVIEITECYKLVTGEIKAQIALEEYVKDMFSGTFSFSQDKRQPIIDEVFSYQGNHSSPPDAMLRGGDAIEVKRVNSYNAKLMLNSSYPKQILSCDSSIISPVCKNAEKWNEKDMLYIIAVVINNKLRHLSLVYGEDFCMSDEYYNRIRKAFKKSIEEIEGIKFTETNELGRINNIDKIGNTYLRVRGMWAIDNPLVIFKDVYERPKSAEFSFMAIINEQKWKSLKNKNKLIQEGKNKKHFQLKNINIKNPTTSKDKKAKLISFYI